VENLAYLSMLAELTSGLEPLTPAPATSALLPIRLQPKVLPVIRSISSLTQARELH
jgi:hypothetical protein